MKRLAVAALLTACAALPPGTMPAPPSDRRAVDAELAAFHAARGPFACAPLDRVDVAAMSPADVHANCFRDYANSCVYSPQDLFGSMRTLIVLRSDVDEHTRAALVAHETGHAARACWVDDALPDVTERMRRFKTGESAGCVISAQSDERHCDSELWTTIERAAIARWEAEQ